MSSHFRLSYSALSALTALSALACVDPQKSFDEFGDRVVDAAAPPDAAPPSDGGGFDGGLPDISGPFLLSLATTEPVPVSPLRFLVTGAVTPGKDGGGTADLTIQPLGVEMCEKGVGGEPVGKSLTIEGVAIAADGTFTVNAVGAVVDGLANPLLCGVPIDSDIQLSGSVQSADGFCGAVGGMVHAPIEGALVGTFAAIRLTEPVMTGDANLPAAVTACQ